MRIQPIYIYGYYGHRYRGDILLNTWVYARVSRRTLGDTGFNYTVAIL